VVAPWVGIIVGFATLALTQRARTRAVVVALPAALLALGGVYIVVEQVQHRWPSVFEWPTLFPYARTPAWIAVVLLAADAIVEVVRRPTKHPSVE
jgi:hypothetical protein